MRYWGGAFHLCFKRNKRKMNSKGLKCLLQCWFCLYTIFKPVGSRCLQLPSKHSAVTAPNHRGATDSIKREDDEARMRVRACLRLEEERLRKTLKPPENKRKKESQGGVMSVHVCVCSFKVTKQLKQNVHLPVLRNL